MNVRDLIKQAAEAYSNLNNYHAIIALCDSGLFVGPRGHKTRNRIVEICKSESKKELAEFDRTTSLIETRARETTKEPR